jgi:hypothetical protein
MDINPTFGRTFVIAIGLVALAAFAAVPAPAAVLEAVGPSAAPVVGPELPISYPSPGAPQDGSEQAVAFGGSVYLAAWVDSRGGVWAGRVNRDGAVLDQSGIPLSATPFASAPEVGFDGTNFLVVWDGLGAVYGRRVSPSGVVLDATDRVLSPMPNGGGNPQVSFDGTNYLVIWSTVVNVATARDIYGARVSPAGSVLDPTNLLISAAPANQYDIDIAFNGSNHLVVWGTATGGSFSNIDGTLVTPAGVAVNPMGVPMSGATGEQSEPVVTAVGGSFFVAWNDYRSGGLSDVFGTRVDAAGAAVDPAGIPIAATPEFEFRPDVAAVGTTVLVAWTGNALPMTVRGARVNASGTVLDPAGIAIPTPRLDPTVASDGVNFLVAGWDMGPVRGSRVTPGGAALDPSGITISRGANGQLDLDLAFDGTNRLVVWSGHANQGHGIFGARVGPDGQILDGTGFRISSGEDVPLHEEWGPSIAFDGTNYLVVWAERQDQVVRAARVSGSGEVLDRFDITTGSHNESVTSPKVAFGGGTFLVGWSWTSVVGFEDDYAIRGTRVSPGGVVLDPAGFAVATTLGPRSFDLAFGGSAFMAVWDEPRTSGQSGIYGTRVTPAGTVPAPAGFTISTGSWETAPEIAWRGDEHLVVWTRSDEGAPGTADVYGARVDDAGSVLDPTPIPISTAPDDQNAPNVAANGPFLVTWNDRRRGVDDVFATRVGADGTVTDASGFTVATSVRADALTGAPVTAAPGGGSFSVAYGRFIAEEPYGTTRGYLKKVAPAPK